MSSSFPMRRLNYRFKEFTRHHWANDETKALWEPRIRDVCACLSQLEWRSILEGIRSCALKIVKPDELQSLSSSLTRYGLTATPLQKIAAGNLYAVSRSAPREGEPFNYWCVIGRASDVQCVEHAHSSNDAETLGRYLGYPTCCTDFYRRFRAGEGFIDTTWPMAQNTTEKRVISPTQVEVTEVSRCNILLRWLGIRMVFHLPCSFDCSPTVELAEKLTRVARAARFHQEMDCLEQMLSWPVEWSALYGLAEIATPVGTIYTVTDATAEKYRVSYRGARPQAEVSTVESFDDRREYDHTIHTKGKHEHAGNQIAFSDECFRSLKWYYADNGFPSLEVMEVSHAPVVKLATATLSQAGGNVLDLGCGNGTLLKKISEFNHNVVPWGVDRSIDRIDHARLLNPRFADNFVLADIFDDCTVWSQEREFAMVILMLGRLIEVPEERAEMLLKRIGERAKNFLVYAYEGYEHYHGSLDDLARKARITVSEDRLDENVGLVKLHKL
ncbi:MAG: class I SAM-dependent methyltransferase [Thermodesulfobacteriota bacterium]